MHSDMHVSHMIRRIIGGDCAVSGDYRHCKVRSPPHRSTVSTTLRRERVFAYVHTWLLNMLGSNFIACSCLNIRLHLPPRPSSHTAVIADAAAYLASLPVVKEPTGRKLTLGLGGVTAEHEALTVAKPELHGWRVVRCLNCDRDIYAYEAKHRGSSSDTSPKAAGLFGATATRRTLLAISPTDGTVCILDGAPVVAGDEVDRVRASAAFSPAFKVVLNDPEKNGLDLPPNAEAAFLEHLEGTLNAYAHTEKSELERRVAEYRAEQQTQLETRLQHAQQDKEVMLRCLRCSDTLRERALHEYEKERARVLAAEGPVRGATSGATSAGRSVTFADTVSASSGSPTSRGSSIRADECGRGGRGHGQDGHASDEGHGPAIVDAQNMVVGSLGRHGGMDMLVNTGATRAERMAARSFGTSVGNTSPTADGVPAKGLQAALERSRDSLLKERMDTGTARKPPTVLHVDANAVETSRRAAADVQHHDSDHAQLRNALDDDADALADTFSRVSNEDIDDSEDMFLLDEEAELECDTELADSPQSGAVASTQNNVGAERSAVASPPTSRLGMHFGTSVMPSQYGSGFGASQALYSASMVDHGVWHRRSRKKFHLDMDDMLSGEEGASEDADEARDGLVALRNQPTGSQSPADDDYAHATGDPRFLATSLPIKIHHQDSASAARRRSRGSGTVTTLPTFDELAAATADATNKNTGPVGGTPSSLMMATGLSSWVGRQDPSSDMFLAAGHSFSRSERTRLNRYSLDHGGFNADHMANDEHGDDDGEVNDDEMEASSAEFVAPHLLAAHNYAGDSEAVFGEVPRAARLHSVAM
ncbi:hypothetical protein THASP1DRAFT_23452 [Thamnocephalis sphaerospora]|uniref:Uncharacterized protein n=1 Tax=Thamnocephalis sphaerospora TaxID=78915 RepID=A0A4P9XT51_9FUNG|nr:hypothetical protein THASP1DRAFT_23452 [Thamnocephalis sphaerospora]|eukprot:RKP08590.1 hypothetical protein THASP1DRAFT_23452 [Thamnocephalis sphaerospora]